MALTVPVAFSELDYAGRPVTGIARFVLLFIGGTILLAMGFVFREVIAPNNLEMTSDGFRLSRWKHPVRWSDVHEFKIIYWRPRLVGVGIHYSDRGFGFPTIAWTLKAGPAAEKGSDPIGTWHRRTAAGTDGTLGGLRLSAKDAVALLEGWRIRYSASGKPDDL
ncbi:hypothetical protein [Brevundimonas aurifodinae]|uniref:PH domain-containing protein n=1 Tax=Brevundimonas aurifodinae TaxID=1508312 RepID=A0ABV1NR36_9CAUL